MPVRNLRAVRSTGRTPRRVTTWARSSGAVTFPTTGARWTTFDLLSDFKTAGGNSQGCTAIRTHLMITVTSANTVGDEFGVGIIRGQNTDVGLGVTGAPRPIDDEFEDWAYWNVFTASNSGGSGTALFFPGGSNVMILDNKAQRRIPELQMSYNLVLQGGGAATSLVWVASTLLKLP